MHMLLHIADDCQNLGCHLDYLGAWPFENGMKILLNSKRSNYRVIQQIFRRETEDLNCRLPQDEEGRILSAVPLSQYVGAPKSAITGPQITVNYHNKKTLHFPKCMGDFKLKANVKDAFCVVATGARSKDFAIVQCTDFFSDTSANDGGVIIVGNPYKVWSDIFVKPKPSHKFHVYKFREMLKQTIKFRAEKVITKLYVLPDLKYLKTQPELDKKYKYSTTPYPKNNTWAANKLGDYPAWFGTGIRHITQGGASLY
jgi:hypothetical protein